MEKNYTNTEEVCVRQNPKAIENFGVLANPEIYSSLVAKPFFRKPKTPTLNEVKSLFAEKNNQKKILKIIKDKNAISDMPLLFNSASENIVESELFYECAKKFFDSNGEKFDGKTQNIHFNEVLCRLYDKNEKDVTKLRRYLQLLASNGYYESFNKVYHKFEKSFSIYKRENDSLRAKIESKKAARNTQIDAIQTEFIKDFLVEKAKKSEEKRGNILKDLLQSFGKDRLLKDTKDHFNNVKTICQSIDKINTGISELQKRKSENCHSFKEMEKMYFDFFNHIICHQFLSEDFKQDVFETTFLKMCKSLFDYLKSIDKNVEDKDEKDIYSFIEENLNSVTGLIFDRCVLTAQKKGNFSYAEYLRLNDVFQKLYKYTSNQEHKLDILTQYAEKENAPIPFVIIEDALSDKFSNTKVEVRRSAVRCLEKRYDNLDGDEFKKSSLKDQSEQIIYKTIINRKLDDSIREDAFQWLASHGKIPNEKRNEYFWKIIGFLDKKNKEYPETTCMEQKMYDICRKHLIRYTDDKEKERELLALMSATDSKGLISDFVTGFSHYGGNSSSFGVAMAKFEARTGKHLDYNNSDWE